MIDTITLQQGQTVKFADENLSYKVMAAYDRYAVVVRKINRVQDAALLRHDVDMGAYCTFKEAWEAQKDFPIYSLIDFEQGVRAPSNLVFNDYDFDSLEDCSRCINDLLRGNVELSHRNRAELLIESINL